MHRASIILSLAVLITGCANQPSSELATTSADQEAKQFTTSPDYANLYFVWPDYLDPLIQNYSGMEVSANGEVLGKILNDQFINVKAAPGTYTISIKEFSDVYDNEHFNKHLSTFDITVAPNSLGIFSCWDYPKVEDDITYVTNSASCRSGKGERKSLGGISYCGKVNEITNELYFGGVKYIHEDNLRCRLMNSKSHIIEAEMIAGSTSLISNDGDTEFASAQAAGTAAAYQQFIRAFPSSKHKIKAKAEYARLAEQEATNTLEKKIQAHLKRDEALPLSVKKDKYMLTLTKHLKQKQFEDSLYYFELIDRLNVELSPSFDYFWGEALLRTGQPDAAINKLYQYINAAGSSGKYYTKALELSNEAEAQL